MMHIHTVSDEVQIKELLRSFEKNEKGDVTEKEMPKFVKAHTKLICRISTRIPVPLEKHDVLPQLGRFTLRDEGRTIAVGKILKYKPANAVALAAVGSSGAKKEEVKTDGGPKPTTTSAQKEELVYDMETEKMLPREEYEKLKKEREKTELEGVDEEDEEESSAA